MSDTFEVIITETQLEIIFTDNLVEVIVQEDNYEILVNEHETEIVIDSENVEILTIAEQGPAGTGGTGGFPLTIGNTAPSNPVIGDYWLDTN